MKPEGRTRKQIDAPDTYSRPADSPSFAVREDTIEYGFIGTLQNLKYEYRPDIRDRAALEANFRQHFEALNRVRLTDAEFARLLDEIVTPDVFTAAKTLRSINAFTRDDGTPLNYSLVNLKDWCKNTFEVIHQLRINTDYSHHRYDVILLINGVPCVQIELKTLGVHPRRAMEQIVEYKHDPGNGYTRTLLCFMQLFIVSNRDQTYYFANNNARHFAFNADERFLPVYEFADEDNSKIRQLDAFAERFLKKCNLGQTLSRYMVLLAGEQKLMMMRPYQVYAVQHMVKCIDEDNGNGYIWHTTGSGKTLTSFKAATLLKENEHIHKCVFVVDRKDLDRQTREEFNRFQEGCVEENTHTGALVRRLLSEDYADKVIVTTIQKLGLALDETSRRNKQRSKNGQATYKEQLEALQDERIVFIFDECHRSQFGENHKAIKAFFPRAQLFGFTGTPIFEANASLQKIEDSTASMRTTADLFQKQLHAYTITHAIEDGNVLRFHVDYFKPEGKNPPKPGEPIAKRAVIEAILAKHDAATGGRRFNALFATASINDAIEYHALFKTMQAEKLAADPEFKPLNIACVFSPPAQLAENPESKKDIDQLSEDLPQEQEDNKVEPEAKKQALEGILADYNARYGTNHRLSEFDLYYQDVQKRIKDQQWPNADYPPAQKIDITIVVDMLLTGFDSKFLNTLYVDKNLKHHGLIQAFSRTNRVLNATKPYGNILDFRQQQDAVDAAIALFSGEKTGEQAREIWLVEKAPVVIQKLEAAVQKLDAFMQSQGLDCTPSTVANLKGDAAKTVFIERFKEVQRLKTQLDQYTDLTGENKAAIEQVLPEETLRGFKGQYLDTAKKLRDGRNKPDKPGADKPADQLDFEFVLFASAVIDYDYIMKLMTSFSAKEPGKAKMTREQLIGLISSDAKFINERDDIAEYIGTLQAGEGLSETAIRDGYTRFKAEKNAQELATIAAKHNLATAALQSFVDGIFERMIFDGERLSDLMAPLDLGWKARSQAEIALMEDLYPLLTQRAGGRDISGLSAYE
ncbi:MULTISPECIES: type I restriction endonuclease subunit R [Acidithiobacillus]|jgi:type I restriction enzyme R subunit|uniref:Type I restriction enzyme endonuclease subunit n=2 Tax=Acidithiobacillus ferrooxidans TaxID=920 RepID=B7J6E5_ACIF2|nr:MULTISPECIES: type I restriction endonuclease subunit R [Acidithiobacillus]MCL5957548.1 type I restriction endonuclease subunit R [Gammaproteobacteria bacterium]ACH84229.1 type I site-specific deoxyribonuclease, HsdR family [Acidithiobacillus ferrooxidans ATCC 53993]ACK80081.1 type I restriction-modification system, R subunit [Acidithiobacillus ferrooxidans ATCC 23270]MBN6745266.1 type I restriction endonuclease subunit R [Acidithiobacillus sp. MC2.2]MBN6747721.1 type I restriction endonucl